MIAGSIRGQGSHFKKNNIDEVNMVAERQSHLVSDLAEIRRSMLDEFEIRVFLGVLSSLKSCAKIYMQPITIKMMRLNWTKNLALPIPWSRI